MLASIITPVNEIDMFLPEGFYSDVYQLVYRCNRMIERNLKDDGTIVDTKFIYDATSRKISVHVGADNVVTMSSDLDSITGFLPRQLTFREERKYKGKVAMDPNRGTISRAKTTPTATPCTHLTSARISPKKDIST